MADFSAGVVKCGSRAMLADLTKHGNYCDVASYLASDRTFSADELADGLSNAAFRKSRSLVKLLLDHGADPNHIPAKNIPAIHAAVEQQDQEVLKLLVDAGADVNLATESGFTPLHLAVDVESDTAWQRGDRASADLVRLLLGLGADPTIADRSGETALDLAVQYSNEDAAAILRRRNGESKGA